MNVLHSITDGFGMVALEVFLALSPLVIIIFVLAPFGLPVRKKEIKKILTGFVITYIGLVFLLQGVSIAFIPIGRMLGGHMASLNNPTLLITISFVLGFLVAFAEPAVRVLNHQVEDISAGAIRSRHLLIAISFGVALAVVLAMVRIMFSLSLWYFLIPGYAIIFLCSRFVDPVYVAIAFDSGGVATGPMCATFLLSFSLGVARQVNQTTSLSDGLGMVALVAMAPILSIMIMGFLFRRYTPDKKQKKQSEVSTQ